MNSNSFDYGINRRIDMTLIHCGGMKSVLTNKSWRRVITNLMTQIEYALVNLDHKNLRATMLLEQERVIRQWEARTCCSGDAYD